MSEKDKAVALHKTSPLYGLAAKFNIEPNKLLEVLRGTVIKPSKGGHQATNEEIAAFCIVAQQYGLNPFTREIHAFSSGEKGIVPIVGIDGWTHIVNASGRFDGCEFEDIADEKGNPVEITCKMHVKDQQHPVCATERFSECKRNTIPWNTMPWRMLRHKAYMQAARYAFGLAGIYDEDEARDIVNVTPLREPVAMPKAIEEESQPGEGSITTGSQAETPRQPGTVTSEPSLVAAGGKPDMLKPLKEKLKTLCKGAHMTTTGEIEAWLIKKNILLEGETLGGLEFERWGEVVEKAGIILRTD